MDKKRVAQKQERQRISNHNSKLLVHHFNCSVNKYLLNNLKCRINNLELNVRSIPFPNFCAKP